MKMLGTLRITWLWISLLAASPALAQFPGTTGEDPFPLKCVDFSGNWKADNGTRYKISQDDCKHLSIKMMWSNYTEDTISIVPDNRSRAIPGMERSAIRNRWNNLRHGSIIESHRTWVDGINKITEVVTYERASSGLLLETTYTTIECLTKPGKVDRDYAQQVFRYMGSAKPSEKGNRKKAR